ncbi:MAG: hypothetical protein WEB00_14545 [Dehalococcoidia bacterium]
MEITKATKDRRGFLAAAVGGLAGLLAGRIGAPAQTVEASHGDVHLGGDNVSDTPTTIRHQNGARCEIAGEIDLPGSSGSVYAALVATGPQNGVYAKGDVAITGRGTLIGLDAAGPLGVKAVGSSVGVDASGSVGVKGESTSNSNDGIGVHAIALGGGFALVAEGTYGGVKTTAGVDQGYALEVDGVNRFKKRSGQTTINAGASSRTVNAFPIYPQALVLATIQGYVAGLWVAGVQPSPAHGRFTIRLNKPAPSTVKVGWFIVN